MNTIDAINARKSVRGYTEQPVDEEILHSILSCGNKAPNAGPIHMSVVRNKELIEEINTSAKNTVMKSDNDFLKGRMSIPGYHPTYGAPVLVVVSAPEGKNSVANCACAVTSMCIAAAEYELGSCYLAGILYAFTGNADLLERIGVPDGYSPQCAFIVGHPSRQQIAGAPKAAKENINYIN